MDIFSRIFGKKKLPYYTLDGQQFPPECLSKRTRQEILQNSSVPLEDWDGRLIHKGNAEVTYQFHQDVLVEIVVSAEYRTDFLGINSGHPEETLRKLGYKQIGKRDEGGKWWVYWTKDNHYVVVSRRRFNDALLELMYVAGPVEKHLEPV